MMFDDVELVTPFITRITSRDINVNSPDQRVSVALAFTLPSSDTSTNGFAVMNSMN